MSKKHKDIEKLKRQIGFTSSAIEYNEVGKYLAFVVNNTSNNDITVSDNTIEKLNGSVWKKIALFQLLKNIKVDDFWEVNSSSVMEIKLSAQAIGTRVLLNFNNYLTEGRYRISLNNGPNAITKEFDVSTPPEDELSDIIVSSNPVYSKINKTLTFTIKNVGNRRTIGWRSSSDGVQRLWHKIKKGYNGSVVKNINSVSDDTFFLNSGYIYHLNLDPDEEKTISVTFDTDLVSGAKYTIFLDVDDDEKELNETNNNKTFIVTPFEVPTLPSTPFGYLEKVMTLNINTNYQETGKVEIRWDASNNSDLMDILRLDNQTLEALGVIPELSLLTDFINDNHVTFTAKGWSFKITKDTIISSEGNDFFQADYEVLDGTKINYNESTQVTVRFPVLSKPNLTNELFPLNAYMLKFLIENWGSELFTHLDIVSNLFK